MNPSLELQLKTLPSEPGVYRYYDKNENLLYVGKAKKPEEKGTFLFQQNTFRIPNQNYGRKDQPSRNNHC